ncbi:MAG: P-loop NTPase fold protein [Salinarimonas sp.]
MKLFPPQSEPALYEEGFGDLDLLGRRAIGQTLSELLERVEDPIVIAVDGPWGSGKTHFLKRWVGAHHLENDGTAITVYFDAFANDYLDDPLIGLTGAISERLLSPKDKNKWKKAKTVAFKLSVLQLGLELRLSLQG